jgi:hypothetical protein
VNCQKTIIIPMKKLIEFGEAKMQEKDIKREDVKQQKQEPKKKNNSDSKRAELKLRELFWDGYSDLGYC